MSAIAQMLDGERDEVQLCEALDMEDSMIIQAILAAIADPTTHDDLLQAGTDEAPAPATDDPEAALPDQLRQRATAIAAAVQRPELRPQLDSLWQQLREQGGGALVDAVQALYAGPADPAVLLDGLGQRAGHPERGAAAAGVERRSGAQAFGRFL